MRKILLMALVLCLLPVWAWGGGVLEELRYLISPVITLIVVGGGVLVGYGKLKGGMEKINTMRYVTQHDCNGCRQSTFRKVDELKTIITQSSKEAKESRLAVQNEIVRNKDTVLEKFSKIERFLGRVEQYLESEAKDL